ncbi:MAG: ABC transporter ATP-binding protein [Candidatus Contendobacter sp.]|nr:ABC transporter ATP-binding protein [Candidatus Contendobacter sp.]
MNDTDRLKSFFSEFWRFDRRAVALAFGLNLMAAALEGLGLMLLLPLLDLAGVLGAGPNAAAPAPARLAGQLLDRLPPDARLLSMLGAFVALIAVQSSIGLLRDRRSLALQLRFVDHLRDSLFGALARCRWSFLSQHHSSEYISVLSTDVQRVGQGTYFLLQLFTQFALFPIYLLVALRLSAPVTGLAVLTGAALWWLLRKSREAAQRGGVALSQANQAMFNDIQEFLGALKLIKIHGEEAGYQRQFRRAIQHLRAQQLAFNAVRTRSQRGYRIGSAVVLAGLTYVALTLARLPAAHLLVLIAIFARMLPQISQVHTGFQQLWHMMPAFENWRRWLDQCEAHAEPAEPAAGVGPEPVAPILREGLALEEVTYRHPRGTQTLRVPRLWIPARATTAIIGPTGCGKTTLLDLLTGLNRPDAGHVLVDGAPLTQRPDWRRGVAYVPQESSILDGTVRENLTWGAGASDDPAIMAALARAAAADFVNRLPQGLETRVGERGVRLSGGEKQRLALARALLRRPALLVLDEATSALDRDNQQIILEALRALHGRMTVLIVTHRYQEILDLVDGIVRVRAGWVEGWEPVNPSHGAITRVRGGPGL